MEGEGEEQLVCKMIWADIFKLAQKDWSVEIQLQARCA